MSKIVGPWIKASASAANGNCVEMAQMAGGGVGLRDSKDPDGLVLDLDRDVWLAFLDGARTGEFDGMVSR